MWAASKLRWRWKIENSLLWIVCYSPHSAHLLPPHLSCLVCRAARADLVFLVDGSWSIGDDNFLKIIRFLYSTTGALDRIGPDGTQVLQRGLGCNDVMNVVLTLRSLLLLLLETVNYVQALTSVNLNLWYQGILPAHCLIHRQAQSSSKISLNNQWVGDSSCS